MDSTRLLEIRDHQTLTIPNAHLVVARGPDTGSRAPVGLEQMVVGSAPTAHLRLTDPAVSRHHFVLRTTPDGYVITDLGSTNGTRLDRRRIQSAYLAVGDRIEIGNTQLRLEGGESRVAIAMSTRESFGRLVGRSVAARRVFALLERVAAEAATVLISGESGTGKDLAAEALHEASPRAAERFVVVDCGALVENLLESELFGHVKGAFTGAGESRVGTFEHAHRGTLFLDEIGELPRDLQPKLLRALERREIRRVGDVAPRAVDVRVIAASNRDLRLAVNNGLLREDLFHRLNVVSIRMPPLRERMEDVPLLAEHFWREFRRDPNEQLPESLLSAFLSHDWPGNVRELRNKVERAALMMEVGRLSDPISGIGEVELGGQFPFRAAKAVVVERFERLYCRTLLERARGNISEAARIASMNRAYLTRLLQKHGLSPWSGEGS
jgi:DNA-binding NtrC family response regulator